MREQMSKEERSTKGTIVKLFACAGALAAAIGAFAFGYRVIQAYQASSEQEVETSGHP
jgi:hypothetical protein